VGALKRFDTDQISICIEHLGKRTVSTIKAGDVLLQETPCGLWMELDFPNSAWGLQTVRYVSIGKLQHASPRVAFGTSKAVRENGKVIWDHARIRKLTHIALTSNPAFPRTAVRLVEGATPFIRNQKLKLWKSSLALI